MDSHASRSRARRRVESAAGKPRLRRTASVLVVAGGVYVVAGFLTHELDVRLSEPASEPSTPLGPGPRTLLTGVFSVHSGRSHDAFGSFEAIAAAARDTDLDFVYVGDHPPDDRSPALPEVATAFRDGVLVIPGQELVANDIGRVLAMGLDTTFRGWQDGEASFVRLIEDRRAVAFVVHGRSNRGRERWKSASVAGLAGWEVFDMSETARRRLREPWMLYHVGTLVAGIPIGLGDLSLLHLTRDGFDIPSVTAFDSLRMQGPLTATAGLNHHPKMELGGRLILPYAPFFRTFLNHVELDAPLPEDAREAEAVLGRAVREGRVFISLGGKDPARGFRLSALDEGRTVAGIGDRAPLRAGTVLRAGWREGARGRIAFRILRDGVELAFLRGGELEWEVPGPGIYRVEVYRYTARFGSLFVGLRPWIFTNPIELGGPEAVPAGVPGERTASTGGGGSARPTGS
ncbi:MAG TPA: hypothetical protein VK849_05150 [Longimicrobiales bacterium]|nr:hypothetical protein [Longimicrobiales bacterium]